MLKSKNRIRLTNDFKNTLKNGESFFCSSLIIKTTKNTFNYSRFGLIVSTKVSKKAVKRNQLKRIIRFIIETNFNKIKSGNDIIIILSKPIIDKEKKDISELLIKGLNRLKLIDI